MTPWDSVAQQFANLGDWIADWWPLLAIGAIVICAVARCLDNAPIDPYPEPLYPVPAEEPKTGPLQPEWEPEPEEWWGTLAEQDQAKARIHAEVDEIVASAWKSEDRA